MCSRSDDPSMYEFPGDDYMDELDDYPGVDIPFETPRVQADRLPVALRAAVAFGDYGTLNGRRLIIESVPCGVCDGKGEVQYVTVGPR